MPLETPSQKASATPAHAIKTPKLCQTTSAIRAACQHHGQRLVFGAVHTQRNMRGVLSAPKQVGNALPQPPPQHTLVHRPFRRRDTNVRLSCRCSGVGARLALAIAAPTHVVSTLPRGKLYALPSTQASWHTDLAALQRHALFAGATPTCAFVAGAAALARGLR